MLFSDGRQAIVGHFAVAAQEFFRFFREWLQRDRQRVVKLATMRLLERHIQGLPETDSHGSLLRCYLANAGGEAALHDLDLKKATVSAVVRSFGADLARDPVFIRERDGVLVVRVVLPDSDGANDANEANEANQEPTTFTEDADVVERA